MDQIAVIFILAFTVESLIEYFKFIVVQHKINWKQIGAIILGVILAVLARVDLYAVAGVTFAVPYVGMVLTGIIFSRGSNYLADFIKFIQSFTARNITI